MKERFTITIDLFNKTNIPYLLDKVSENILIANAEYEIVWMNQSAKELLKIIGPFVQIENPEDFIGQSITRFHDQQSLLYMKNGQFPHAANITLFHRFKSNIIVETLTSDMGEKLGYVLTWKDFTEFENAIQERDEKIKQLDTPIIPLANDTSVLVPILGIITDERINYIQEKVLIYCFNHQITDILFDLSGVEDGLTPQTASCMQQLQTALSLMGVEPVYVGIKPELAQSLVRDQIFINAKTFSSFKQGIFYIWNKTGFKLTK